MADQRTFIYDLDDTLLDNHQDYSRAQLAFANWMIDTLGRAAPDAQALLNLQVDIDHAAAERWGFGKDRFPSSLVETYRRVCAASGIVADPAREREAYAIGTTVFDEDRYRQKGLIPGAQRTLDFHREKGDELILLTKGDREVQESKIRALRLERWFGDRTHIVAGKNPGVLALVVQGREYARIWHVGNSIRSDVQPALDAGMGAVYCPCETWQFERQHGGVPKHPRLTIISRIADLINCYDRLA